ncbi:hypothetical protein [Phenylobacterium sp.]|uniref:hypothetical protein n=1 Tax=Phenylobacterium sp. TaxID=1871053 RepID=UPI0025D3AF5E|nr:hypothetical protein [Phenylobacterium sp.]MBX3483388.1 hypothetical protein [Phenylobacterium sp.]MCW5759708.1 hypothetical protein [Phenylobacterium sp.]
MSLDEDLAAAAEDELDRALTLGWPALAKVTPWGDTFDGFTPDGRDVCFERAYMWEGEPGGDIRVEIMVYESKAYEAGVKRVRTITRDGNEG